MKNKNKSCNAGLGAVAGIIGGFALAGTAAVIYGLTTKKDTLKEAEVEPNDPFIVLAKKFQKATGMKLNERQEKFFEQGVGTTINATAGAAYAALSNKWKLDWLTGGAVYGLICWAAIDEGLETALGLVGDNKKYPIEAHARGIAAHLVFGIVTAGLYKAFECEE